MLVIGRKKTRMASRACSAIPDTDLGVRVLIRFRRHLRSASLNMRVYWPVGHGRIPFHDLIKIDTREFEVGERVSVQVLTVGIPQPGWDHTIPRGWGPTRPGMSTMPDAKGIAIIECRHRLGRQTFKVYVEQINHPGEPRLSLYVQDEDDEVFVTGLNELGSIKYGH